jgi:hypothetical protein
MRLTWIAPGLLAGLGIIVAPACAHRSVGVSLHHHRYHPELAGARQAGYERGYHDGMKAGIKDWERDRHFDCWRHRRYREASSGYRSRYGPRSVYSRAYRAGFEEGYRLGYGPVRGRYRY